MQDNPFITMAGLLAPVEHGSIGTLTTGTVVEIPDVNDPSKMLKVNVQGLVKEVTALRKNANLGSFDLGDLLLLYPTDEQQRWIILCKVVSA